MADRSPVQITIGGKIPIASIPDLIDMIALDHALTLDSEEPVDESHFVMGQLLELAIAEAAGGSAENIEDFCVQHSIAFVRNAGGCCASYGPHRVVFEGCGRPRYYSLSDPDQVMLSRSLFLSLGSFEAVDAWFEEAVWTPDPISFDVNMVSTSDEEETGHGR
ncbi:MAG: hypothetical protein WBL20_05325 [Sphingobium sp.]|uniref:hypothetical protein n=1 Tax=Sphingobium sp. TaxID=1912891 RepID=UPI003BAEDA24